MTSTPMPIPHVRPQREAEEVEERPVTRIEFIRDEATGFMHDILSRDPNTVMGNLIRLADECISAAEYIWEESKRITR